MSDSTFALIAVAALAALLVLCLAVVLGLRYLARLLCRPAVEAPPLPADAERYEIGKAYVGLVPAPDLDDYARQLAETQAAMRAETVKIRSNLVEIVSLLADMIPAEKRQALADAVQQITQEGSTT